MANAFVDPKIAAATSLALIRADVVLGRTVYRDTEGDFAGRVGDTVTVRRPGRRTAHTLASGGSVVIDDIANPGVAVQLDSHLYNGSAVTDKEMTLVVEDFATEVISPIAAAVAEGVETILATKMQSVVEQTGDVNADGSNIAEFFTAARKALRDAKAPQMGLFTACGTGIYAAALASDLVTRVDASGTTSGLRDAAVDRLLGFTVVESNLLAEDEVVFYHKEAFALATRAPLVPDGVSWGESLSEGGYSLRLIKDYDSDKLNDRVIGSVFAGAATLTPAWALRYVGIV